jgi:hypothetical protein
MIYLTFLSAFALSACAAFYSVIGLAAIFPGSYWPIIVMGSVLEASKLVTTSWVYRNWKTAPRIMKYYLTTAIAILMLITSMGIFGYLSKAHLEHSTDVGPTADKVAILDEKIKTERDNIETNRKQLKQMDDAVDQVMGRSQDEKGADKAVAIRRSQQKERSRLLGEITTSQQKISSLSDERAPIANELRKAESDFGPIKYVAELIYGSGERDIIDKAVRLVIMLIMVVFDPLAVLLLIAANMSMKEEEAEGKPIIKNGEIVGLSTKEQPNLDIPVFVPPKVKEEDNKVHVEKENIAEIKEEPQIVIDEASGETIPPITSKRVEHHAPGIFSEHHEVEEPVKKLEPKYDYDAEYAFKEKKKLDGGDF